MILNTDDAAIRRSRDTFSPNMMYPVQSVPMYGRGQSIQMYLPARSAQVLAPVSLRKP